MYYAEFVSATKQIKAPISLQIAHRHHLMSKKEQSKPM